MRSVVSIIFFSSSSSSFLFSYYAEHLFTCPTFLPSSSHSSDRSTAPTRLCCFSFSRFIPFTFLCITVGWSFHCFPGSSSSSAGSLAGCHVTLDSVHWGDRAQESPSFYSASRSPLILFWSLFSPCCYVQPAAAANSITWPLAIDRTHKYII